MLNPFHFFKFIKLALNTKQQNEAGRILRERNVCLSIAESCTGGLLSSLMTDVSGSSSYTKANFITYANEAKTKYLNVKQETLQKYGAVSSETVQEMVRGLLDDTECDFAIATTGIAGPTGGNSEKPVGLVYIGVGKQGKIEVFKYNANPEYPRFLIKYLFAKKAVDLLADFLRRTYS